MARLDRSLGNTSFRQLVVARAEFEITECSSEDRWLWLPCCRISSAYLSDQDNEAVFCPSFLSKSFATGSRNKKQLSNYTLAAIANVGREHPLNTSESLKRLGLLLVSNAIHLQAGVNHRGTDISFYCSRPCWLESMEGGWNERKVSN